MPTPRRIDRAAARLEFEAGRSYGEIARRQGVSAQAVAKLVGKSGWERGGDGALLGETATAKRIFAPLSPADFRIASEGIRTLPRMSAILDAIAEGATRSVAAGLAGIGEETLREWAKQDAQFAALIREAESRKTWRRISALERASERGDTSATRILLERDPASRGEFGPPGLALPGDGTAGVVINLVLGPIAHAMLASAPQSLVRTIDQPVDRPVFETVNSEKE
jgi:hypothetical protein